MTPKKSNMRISELLWTHNPSKPAKVLAGPWFCTHAADLFIPFQRKQLRSDMK
jgi:hypothetical protein